MAKVRSLKTLNCYFGINGYSQNVRNTSPPKKTKLMNMKNIKMQSSLYNCYSLDSSLFAPFAPGAFPDPKMSSHVKFKENKAGNSPIPIMKPPPFYLLPNNPLPEPA